MVAYDMKMLLISDIYKPSQRFDYIVTYVLVCMEDMQGVAVLARLRGSAAMVFVCYLSYLNDCQP